MGGGDDPREEFRTGVVLRRTANVINQDVVSEHVLFDDHAVWVAARKLIHALWHLRQTGAVLVFGRLQNYSGCSTVPC